MMGISQAQKDLFTYSIDLDKRVREDNPLRAISEQIDFTFVRQEVGGCYGYNGNVSVDPAVIMKLMFLLFYDDVASERELMAILSERLDYLWFVGYGLDDQVPNHSVLSKARARWGVEVFERLFVRVVQQCVQAGLERPYYDAENKRLMSTTDPDASVVRKGALGPRARYKNHRVVDNAQGVITALETTSGDVAENSRLQELVEQHEYNTGSAAQTIVADRQYGTAENYRGCQERGWRTHMGDMLEPQKDKGRREGIFSEKDFTYDATTDTYQCPAGEMLIRRKHKTHREAWEYAASCATCRACGMRAQCTRSRVARTIKRHEGHELIQQGRAEAQSAAARQDQRRRKWLMEGSFADAANNHGFKRARWRRLWRQRIQDYMIAAVQNVRILIRSLDDRSKAAVTAIQAGVICVQIRILALILFLRSYPRSTLVFQRT